MNFIEKVLKEVLKKKFNISLEEYQEMITPDEIEYDKALIEAGMLAVMSRMKNKND